MHWQILSALGCEHNNNGDHLFFLSYCFVDLVIFLSYNMASSPYLSSDLKAYLRKFDIESLINRNVNDLCRTMP